MQESQEISSQFDLSNEALPNKLGYKHLLKLFPKMGYQAVIRDDAQASDPSDLVPLYFTSEQILLFPPCTDNPNASQLPSIEATLARAFGQQRELLNSKEWLLFPIYEEWNYQFKPRRNWVLLAYSRVTNQFYLLDPTGPYRASLYKSNLKYLNSELKVIFKSLLPEVKDLEPCYLDLQLLGDSQSSGHWVAYFIVLFASGTSLDEFRQLSKRRPALLVAEVSTALSELSTSTEDQLPEEENSSPTLSAKFYVGVSGINLLTYEKRDYGQPSALKGEAQVNSLLSSGERVGREPETTVPPQLGFGFKIDLYSLLIFSGTVAGLIALFCLASTTSSILSATAATGILVVGTALFVGGALGKCGLFGGTQPTFDASVPATCNGSFVVP